MEFLLVENEAHLFAQIFLLEASVFATAISIYMFKRLNAMPLLKKIFIPFTLFVLLSVLDAMYTVKGVLDIGKTFGEISEGNKIIWFFLQSFGWPGLSLVLTIWLISSSFLAIYIYKNSKTFGTKMQQLFGAIILFEFYYLASLHYFGIASWSHPLDIIPRINVNNIVSIMLFSSQITFPTINIFLSSIVLGLELTAIHLVALFFFTSFNYCLKNKVKCKIPIRKLTKAKKDRRVSIWKNSCSRGIFSSADKGNPILTRNV